MKYGRDNRQAIKHLSGSARALFDVIEEAEKGEIADVIGLCTALNDNPRFVFFSCLSGDGKRESLGADLGVLFTSRLRAKAEEFTGKLTAIESRISPLVIVDDTEPVRFWKWKTSQEEISTWCEMVVEDSDIPKSWNVRLWSEIEKDWHNDKGSSESQLSYEEFYESRRDEVERSVVYHKLFQHIKMFPNKGLGDMSAKEATINKLVQYQFQSLVLGCSVPNAVLIQTETPWEVKDPIFSSPYGKWVKSIIHPFEARR